MKIIVLQNNDQYGPFDVDELQTIVDSGHFHLTDLCWSEGWNEWRLLSSVVKRLPTSIQNNFQVNSEDSVLETISSLLQDQPILTPSKPSNGSLVDSPPEVKDTALKPGMIVKNDSQLVSCDFITSLAVRGIYVRPVQKGQGVPSNPDESPDASYHVARSGELIGFWKWSEISDYLKSGVLMPTDLVWDESKSEWMRLASI